QRVGTEPVEVQQQRRVLRGFAVERRDDVLEAAVAVTPEGRAPGTVQVVHAVVTVSQPFAERRSRVVAVASPVAATEFVAHMPHAHRRVIPISFAEALHDAGRMTLPGRVAGAPLEPAALVIADAPSIHREN